jgi:hypothetical protein
MFVAVLKTESSNKMASNALDLKEIVTAHNYAGDSCFAVDRIYLPEFAVRVAPERHITCQILKKSLKRQEVREVKVQRDVNAARLSLQEIVCAKRKAKNGSSLKLCYV